MALLEAQDLVKVYPNGKRAVQGVSFSVEKGEIVGLLGPNGAGKSTSFRMACGLTAPTDGKIFLNGKNVSSWPMYQRCRVGMGYLPQDHSYFVKLTVEENMTAVARPGPWTLAKVYDLFPRLAERRRNLGNQLSGGEQQMLAVARALILNPRIILLDEPLEGLAPIIIDELLAALRKIIREEGLSAILVEQNAQKILGVTDRAIVIERGRIVYSDKTQLIGEVFPLGEEELEIVRDGGTEAEVSDLGEPENPTTAEIIAEIAELTGWQGELITVPDDQLDPGFDTAQHLVADTTRFREELGYAERVPRPEALSRTIAWERANPPEDPLAGIDYEREDALVGNR